MAGPLQIRRPCMTISFFANGSYQMDGLASRNGPLLPLSIGCPSLLQRIGSGATTVFSKCFQVDVGKVDANIHPEMSLLEHILLKMDFNYLDTVNIIESKIHRYIKISTSTYPDSS